MMRNQPSEFEMTIGQVVAVGVVRSSFLSRDQAPKQGREALSESSINIFPQYRDALEGLSPNSYAFVFTWLDKANRDMLKAHPRGDRSRPKHGVFSTRSPDRPNPIGFNLVKIISIEDIRLRVEGMDTIDGTHILDIKPFVSAIDIP